jgi:hypothetical protein
MAGRTLAELCRKLGESILSEILQVLEKSMQGDVRMRKGVCFSITEILGATTKQQLEGQYVYPLCYFLEHS